MSILTCEKVTQRFGLLAAVEDLSFEVEGGEIFGIAGPNGAGKTTLFNVITGVYRGSGDIIFDNVNITRLRTYQICHKGLVRTFQIPQLFSTLTMLANLKVGAHFGILGRDNEEENIREVLELLGLKGKENVIAANLNLYDKKLTMLAAALTTKPKLVLLDEPIGGLSPPEVKEFVALVQKINQELGLTIVIIEHLMKVLIKLSNRLMIMENGQRIAIGPPEEVVKDEKVIEVYLGRSKYA